MVSQVNAQVMSEDFGNSSLPTGWTNTSSSPSGNGLWKFSGNPGYNLGGTQDFTAGGGGWYAWVDGSTPATVPDVTLETDDISMTVGSAASLTFWLRSENTTNPGDNQTISVNFYDGSAWNNGVWTYAGDSPTWDEISINLGAYPVTGSGDVRFQFVVNKTTAGTAFYNDILIDDIEVGVLLDDNAGLDAFTSPTVPFCSDTAICVILSNSGLLPLTTVDISYTINGGTPVTYAWTGNLASGSTDTVCIDTIQFVNGDYLVAYTSNPNGSPEDPAGSANDTIDYDAVSGLSGTYQIPADYVDFTAAVADLNTFGICGDVVFNVAAGTYNEQIVIGDITGTGPSTVTFQGATGIAGDVVLEFDPSATFSQDGVVKMEGSSWFNFQDMTIDNLSTTTNYGRVVYMVNGCTNTSFDNCILDGSPANTTSLNNTVVEMAGNTGDNSFTNNDFIGGSYSMRTTGSSASHSENFTFEDNNLQDFYYFGVYCYYTDYVSISGNTVTSIAPYTSMRGIYLFDCDKDVSVDHNFINNDPNTGGSMYYGIYLSNCDGSLNNHLNVSNNCLTGGNPTYTGFAYTISFWNSGIMDVYNNTVHRVTSPTSTSGYVHYISGGGLISEKNNSFTTTGSMYVRYVTSTYSMIESENNNYHNFGGNFLYLNGLYSNVEDFATQTGFDQNSVSTNPMFADTLACETCNDTLDQAGTAIATVLDDVNGEIRSSTPDIGAVEYIAAGSFDLGGDSTYCASELLLESGPAQSVTWNVDGVPSSNPTVLLEANNAEPQTFNVSVNILTSFCGPASDNLLVTLVPGAELDSNVHICADETATLEPGGGNTAAYDWSTGETSATIDVDAAGTYSVTKMEDGCESDATIVVTKSTAVELLDVDVCSEDLPFSLDATIPDGVSYAWSGGSAVTSAVNQFNDGDNYSVTVTDAFACVTTDNFQLTVLEEPVASILETHNALVYFFDASSSIYVTSSSTITWDFGDGNTGTGLNATNIYSWSNPGAPTSYTVTLTIDNGCGEPSIATFEVTPSVGINDVVTGSFAVYPNPANDLVNIQLTQSFGEQGSVEFVDISGRTVKTATINASSDLAQFDVAELASGTYLIKITGDSQVLVSRVTIK